MIITYLFLRLLLHVLRGVSSISLRRLSSSPLPQIALRLRASGDGFIADRHSFGSCGSFASKKEMRPGAVKLFQRSDRKKGQKKGNKVVARCAVCWWWVVVVDRQRVGCLLPMKFGTGLSQPASSP